MPQIYYNAYKYVYYIFYPVTLETVIFHNVLRNCKHFVAARVCQWAEIVQKPSLLHSLKIYVLITPLRRSPDCMIQGHSRIV